MYNMDTISIISLLIGGTGVLGFFNGLINMDSTRKKSKAEAESMEISNLEKSITIVKETLLSTIEQTDKRLDDTQKELWHLKKRYEEKVISIRQAYACNVPSQECPILLKQAEFDAKYECEECGGCTKANMNGNSDS